MTIHSMKKEAKMSWRNIREKYMKPGEIMNMKAANKAPARPNQRRRKIGEMTNNTPKIAGARRAVKSLSPKSQYISAVMWKRKGPCMSGSWT